MNALAIAESVLLHARYCGLLSMHMDVQAAARTMAPAVAGWSETQRTEALAWSERGDLDDAKHTAPEHVTTFIARTARDYKGGAL